MDPVATFQGPLRSLKSTLRAKSLYRCGNFIIRTCLLAILTSHLIQSTYCPSKYDLHHSRNISDTDMVVCPLALVLTPGPPNPAMKWVFKTFLVPVPHTLTHYHLSCVITVLRIVHCPKDIWLMIVLWWWVCSIGLKDAGLHRNR